MIKTYAIAVVRDFGVIPMTGFPLMTLAQAEHYAYQMQLGGMNVVAYNVNAL
jgi:hypothetical protein